MKESKMFKKSVILGLIVGSVVFGATDYKVMNQLVNSSIKSISVQQELKVQLNKMDKNLKLRTLKINKEQKEHNKKLDDMKKELSQKPSKNDYNKLSDKTNKIIESISELKINVNSKINDLKNKFKSLDKEFVKAGYFKAKSNEETMNNLNNLKKENVDLKLKLSQLNQKLKSIQNKIDERDKTIMEINNRLTSVVEKLLKK